MSPPSLGKGVPRVLKWLATVAVITPSGHLFCDNIADMLSTAIGRVMPVVKEPFWGYDEEKNTFRFLTCITQSGIDCIRNILK